MRCPTEDEGDGEAIHAPGKSPFPRIEACVPARVEAVLHPSLQALDLALNFVDIALEPGEIDIDSVVEVVEAAVGPGAVRGIALSAQVRLGRRHLSAKPRLSRRRSRQRPGGGRSTSFSEPSHPWEPFVCGTFRLR